MTTTKTHYIPAGYHTLTSYLIVKGAAKAIDWYKDVFGATEIMRMPAPGGRIGHAELKVGDSVLMVADEDQSMGYTAPQAGSRSPVGILIYLEDVDSVYKKAKASGATIEQELTDKFYGDRSAGIADPFGHRWYISTHTEDVTPEEMKKRMAAMSK
jgi:PhnB protein